MPGVTATAADRKATTVGYSVNDYGYEVNVYDANGQPIDHYSAGNHALDSQGQVERGDPARLTKTTLRRFAKQTALEMAADYGVDSFCVQEEKGGD